MVTGAGLSAVEVLAGARVNFGRTETAVTGNTEHCGLSHQVVDRRWLGGDRRRVLPAPLRDSRPRGHRRVAATATPPVTRHSSTWSPPADPRFRHFVGLLGAVIPRWFGEISTVHRCARYAARSGTWTTADASKLLPTSPVGVLVNSATLTSACDLRRSRANISDFATTGTGLAHAQANSLRGRYHREETDAHLATILLSAGYFTSNTYA